jgi:hypothetical protein
LAPAVERLISHVGHWQPVRWAAGLQPVAAPVADPGTGTLADPGAVASRGDRVYALVQRLADRAADTAGEPRRPVPRLADLVLPDQLRVIVDELLGADASGDTLVRAAEDVNAVHRTL